MKNIILQYWEGELNNLVSLSSTAHQKYARTIGADYKLLSGPAFRKGLKPQMQKMAYLNEEFDEYDNVLMIDTDTFPVKGLNENVFDVEGYGLFTPWIQERGWKRFKAQHPLYASNEHPFFGGEFYKFPRYLRIKMRSLLNDGDITYCNNIVPMDEGLTHRLSSLANISTKGASIPENWCLSSYWPIDENTKIIHIRPKQDPERKLPRKPKIETYQKLKERGILE